MDELTAQRINDLARELVQRGWMVTAAEANLLTLIVGFNFMPNRAPSWLKAFEVPLAEVSVEAFERRIEAWKHKVRDELARGKSSETVRRQLAEHGPDAVKEAMRARGDG